MASQQIVDYIAAQLKAGFSEQKLREHLQTYGWSQSAVDDAFASYQKTQAPKPGLKKPRRGGKQVLPKWGKRRWLQTSVAFAIVAIVALVVVNRLPNHRTPIKHVAAAPLTMQQKETIDVNTIAGAIGQYANANNALPTRLSVGINTNLLVMCDSVCNPTTSQISPLMVYDANHVKIEPYVADLSVPDTDTVYLVAQADCANGRLGTADSKPRSMVLLYAVSNGASFNQRCIKL